MQIDQCASLPSPNLHTQPFDPCCSLHSKTWAQQFLPTIEQYHKTPLTEPINDIGLGALCKTMQSSLAAVGSREGQRLPVRSPPCVCLFLRRQSLSATMVVYLIFVLTSDNSPASAAIEIVRNYILIVQAEDKSNCTGMGSTP